MPSALSAFFDATRFPARWLCGEWTPGLAWLHILSDLAIWSAYFSIPALLFYLARRRTDLPFRRVFLLFGAFILLCGTTHLIEAVIFWWPIYPAAGMVKLATAATSWGTVFALAPVVRDALTLRSPAQLEAEVDTRIDELRRLNQELASEAAHHRRTLDSLHRTEERLRLALEAGGMGAWEWDLRDNRVEWTGGLEAMHGLAPGDFGGTLDTFVALIHPDDRPQVQGALDTALRDGTQFSTEFRTTRLDGSHGWVAGVGRAHYDADGRPQRMIGIGLDVTARRRGEEAARFLAEAGQVLGEVADVESTVTRVVALSVPRFADHCAASLLTESGDLRRVALQTAPDMPPANVAVEAAMRDAAMVGASAMRVARSGVSEFLPSLDPAMIRAAVADPALMEWLLGLGLRSSITVAMKTRGRVLGTLTFFTAGSGRIYSTLDVQLAEQLAERVATAIENARLYEALRAADRRKDHFLAVLAHELRNPLSPLATAAELLARPDIVTADRLRACAVLRRQVSHLARLVDDLLDVARIGQGKIALKYGPTTLDETVQRALEMVSAQALAAGQTIATEVTGGDEAIVIDGSRVVQALANLLANAVKFSPAGGRIGLRAAVDGGEAVVTVSDEGIGYAPERAERLFEMFAQEPADHHHGGLGIGLFLVRAIAELHGGTATGSSDGAGLGSTFTLRVPAAAGDVVSRPIYVSQRRAPRRILVADDNRDSAQMLALLLAGHGHDVQVAFDGAAALALAATFDPEVALLDLGMPLVDGYAVVQQLTATARRPALVVAVSGWGDAVARQRSAAAGFDHHLVKPVQWDDLERVLYGDAG